MKRVIIAIIAAFVFYPFHSYAGSKTIFVGIPLVKISEGGISRIVEDVPKDKSTNLICVVSEINGKYYWATRKNKELLRHESDNFITFVAIDGSGYVKVVKKEKKKFVSALDPVEAKFDYVEHMLLGLKNVTYYGVFE